eukprot:762604-Hanusia_phi.AAC.8
MHRMQETKQDSSTTSEVISLSLASLESDFCCQEWQPVRTASLHRFPSSRPLLVSYDMYSLSQSHVGGKPVILVVVTRHVVEEEELLVDYGDIYWAGSAYRVQ